MDGFGINPDFMSPEEKLHFAMGIHPSQLGLPDSQPALPAGGQPPAPSMAKASDALPAGITLPAASSIPHEEPNIPAPQMASPQLSDQGQHENELHRLQSTGSGLDQFSQRHHILGPIARIGDIAGSVLFPGVMQDIPGTSLHHNQLMGQQEHAINRDIGQDQEEAKTGETQAHTNEQNAQAESLRNPKPEKATKPEPIFDKAGNIAGFNTGTDLLGPHNPALTPDMKDIMGSAEQKDAKVSPPHVTYDAGIPVSVTSGDKTYDINDPKLPPELKPLVDSANRAHGQHISEDSKKQAAAFAQQEHMHDEKQNDLTSSTKSMVEAAPGVLSLSARVRQLVDQQEKSLGPTASRWSEFMAGKVGAPNPEFTKLRTDVGLLTTKLMRMHVGARGGELMMQHFQNLIDSGKQSPENMRAALDEIDQYAKETQGEKGGGKDVEKAPAGKNDPLGIR